MRTTRDSSSKERLKEIHKNMKQQYGFTNSEIKRFEKKVKKDPQKFRSMSQDELIEYIKKGKTALRLKRVSVFIALAAIVGLVWSQTAGKRHGYSNTGNHNPISTKSNTTSTTNTVIPLEGKKTDVITASPPANTSKPKSTTSNEYNSTAEPTEKSQLIAELKTIPEKTETPAIVLDNKPSPTEHYVTAEPTEKPTPTVEPKTMPEETDMPDAYDNNPSPKEIELVLNAEYYAEVSYMKGRGFSDYAGIEPNYVGAKGFAAVYCDEALENDKDCFNTPWRIPVYQMGDRGLVESGYIDHKSQIGILDQYLSKKNGKEYEGYLWFVDFASNMTGYINVKNFVTVAYWNYDAIDSIEKGYAIAEYKQTSKYNPVLSNGNRVKVSENDKVLLLAKGTYFLSVADKAHYPLVGVIFVEKNGRYEKRYVFFNVMDLRLIY